MSEILGHDVDGRPLRAGDRVVVVKTKYAPENQGKVTFVRGPCPYEPSSHLEINIRHCIPFFNYYSARFEWLRRIDDRSGLGSWDEIEKITGWNPTKQTTEA